MDYLINGPNAFNTGNNIHPGFEIPGQIPYVPSNLFGYVSYFL